MQNTELTRLASCVGVLLVVTAAGCSESGVDLDRLPTVDPVAIKIRNGDAQTGAAGDHLPVRPTVIVSGANDEPAPNVDVTFKVTRGGGRVLSTRAKTNRFGMATSGLWTLGTAPGENQLEAHVEGLDPVVFSATAVSEFNITVRYISSVTEAQRLAIDSAVKRWTNIVVNDVFDLRMVVNAATCFPQQPAIDEVVDDLLLYIRFDKIDGPGRILGRAGPCYVRTLNVMPIMALIELDSDDLIEIERDGALVDLIMHEMGHTLGFGTIWPLRSLVAGMGGIDPLYTGTAGLTRYRMMGGDFSGVPVENNGGPGTRDAHWRESTFGVELMTGYLTGNGNLLSAFSVASLEDLGYRINVAGADQFDLGAAFRATSGPGAVISLDGREELLVPSYAPAAHGVQPDF